MYIDYDCARDKAGKLLYIGDTIYFVNPMDAQLVLGKVFGITLDNVVLVCMEGSDTTYYISLNNIIKKV
jgi:hypothetical protein